MVPTRWEDRPQQHAFGVLIFNHITRTKWGGVTVDFGRPGDHNIAIIREPDHDGAATND